MRVSIANSPFLILAAGLCSTPSFASHPPNLNTHSHSTASRSLLSSSKQRLRLRDASTVMSGGDNSEGSAHYVLNSSTSPEGSFMKDLSVGDGGDELMLYWSRDIDDADVSVLAFSKVKPPRHCPLRT